MTYLQLMSYVSTHFSNNENMNMLTKFTISQYIQYVPTKDLVSNKVLADNWELRYTKAWNDKLISQQEQVFRGYRDANIAMYEPVKDEESNMVYASNFLNLKLSNVLKKYDGRIEYNYAPMGTRDNYFNHVNHFQWTKQPWYVDGIVYDENVNNKVDTEKPITIQGEFNEIDAIEYFVGKDMSCNGLRQLIIDLEKLHIQEHQKQLEEGKYDKLPFELNEILQENAHRLIIKCEEHMRNQINKKKLSLV